MRRSVLARVMLDIWGEGDSLQEAVAAVVVSHGARPAACCAGVRVQATL